MEKNSCNIAVKDTHKTNENYVPKEINSRIKGGCIAAIIFSLLAILFLTYRLNIADKMSSEFINYSIINLLIILILSAFLWSKSRVAAVLLLIHTCVAKVFFEVNFNVYIDQEIDIPIAAILFYFYFQSMVGTFQYHQYVERVARIPTQPLKVSLQKQADALKSTMLSPSLGRYAQYSVLDKDK